MLNLGEEVEIVGDGNDEGDDDDRAGVEVVEVVVEELEVASVVLVVVEFEFELESVAFAISRAARARASSSAVGTWKSSQAASLASSRGFSASSRHEATSCISTKKRYFWAVSSSASNITMKEVTVITPGFWVSVREKEAMFRVRHKS